jgi:branched-chain amino acid transport system substrate-binding protein
MNGLHRLGALLVVLLLAGAARTALAQGTPYEIDTILSQTGPGAFLGSKEAASLTVLESVVNATGGIKGRPVRFVIHDDQTNPQTAVQLVSMLKARHVPVIMGPILTAVCAAVQPIVERDGPVTYCTSPTLIPKSNTYMFIGAPSLDDVEPVVLRYIKSRGWRRLALITSTDASGQDFERRFDPILARPEFRGMELVEREHFNPADISVTAQIARIKAAKPDVLLSFTVGTPFGTLLRSIRDAGLDVPVYASGGDMTYAQMNQYASFLPKELFFNGAHGIVPEPDAPPAMKRAQAIYFEAMKKAGLRPEFATTIPWDPASVLIDALRHIGPDATAAQIFRHLQNLRSWTGIEGTYNFSTHDQRGIGESAAAVFRWDASRSDFVQIYPR